MTIFLTSPEMIEPSFVTLLDTTTAMYSGTAGGGPELLPGSVIHSDPHVGAALVFSKPLKLGGATPPLSWLFWCHCEPQKYTLEPTWCCVWLPITNTPSEGKANAWHAW